MSGARVLVAGCGYLGTELGRRLAGRGDRVWGLRRRPGGLPRGVEPLAADLGEPATLRELPEALEVVVYAASADRHDDAGYARAYVEGPANLLAALREAGQAPRLVLFTSSTAVYAQTDGSDVDEDSETRPAHFSGRRVLEGEAVVRGCGWPAAVLRLGGLYGPGRTRLIDRVRQGGATFPDTWSNRIHRDDAAAAMAHLMDLSGAAPVWVGVDAEPAPLIEVARWIAARIGAPEPAPGAAARQPASSRALRSNKRCSSARLRAGGFHFRYPSYREGYEALLGEARPGGG